VLVHSAPLLLTVDDVLSHRLINVFCPLQLYERVKLDFREADELGCLEVLLQNPIDREQALEPHLIVVGVVQRNP